jgi:hypothetical protein
MLIKQMKTRWLIISLSLLLIVMNISCNPDQVESKYSNFKSAAANGFFEKGWIPKELAVESMTEISLLTDLDRNTCIFTYLTTKKDMERIKTLIRPVKSKETLKYVPQSKEWIESVKRLKHNFIVTNDKADTVFVAIDDSNKRVFGWRN